jgi:hypothetical protein
MIAKASLIPKHQLLLEKMGRILNWLENSLQYKLLKEPILLEPHIPNRNSSVAMPILMF